MNIGQAAKRSGVSAKMIRYYESIGLVPSADRLESGYRDYAEDDVHRLVFVRRARDLGFSIPRIQDLLELWGNSGRSNGEVRALAASHVSELEAQARKITGMIGTLRGLMTSCERAGHRAHCPIMDELADHHRPPPVRSKAKARVVAGRQENDTRGAGSETVGKSGREVVGR